MNTFEKLVDELDGNVDVVFTDGLPINYKGLYSNEEGFEVILLSDKIETCADKACVLAEEIGHYESSFGNILDLTSLSAAKQEIKARRLAHDMLITLDDLIEAFNEPCKNKFELAEFLEVTEDFLSEAVDGFKVRFGPFAVHNDYIVYFEPLAIMKLYNEHNFE